MDNENSLTLPANENLQTTVDEFNSFFTNKIQKIRDSFPRSSHSADSYQEQYCGIPLFSFTPTTPAEIKSILTDITIKSCDLDPLPASLINEHSDSLIPLLSEMVNASLSSSDMSGLKIADLTPLIKGNNLDPNTLKNYRPVSNLAFLGKLVERVVQRRLEDHLTRNNLHIPQQSGYKKGFSTETLLIRIVNDLLIASDEGKGTVLMLLDLSAAFDTVDHNVLLRILEWVFPQVRSTL